MQRLNIGDDVNPSDLGNSLRNVITKRNEAQLTQKSAEYKKLEIARDDVVAKKEASNVFLSDMKGYKDLVTSLQSELKPGTHSDNVSATFRRILTDINPAEISKDQTAPRSFQAIDEVRRNLGRVFEGDPPTGYEGISADIARKYYAKISALQKEYAGDAQTELLDRYAAAMKNGAEFMSSQGKKFTAVDRNAENMFRTDAATLPRQFFSTSQGIRDLISLAGDRAVVEKAAKDFATTELANLDERGVRNWMTKRRELLASFPTLRDSVLNYANTLQQGERVAAVAEQGISKLKSASSSAEAAIKERGAEATQLLGPKGQLFPVQNVNELLLKGDTKQWSLAAPYIHSTPGGKAMLEDALRQVLSDKAEQSMKGLSVYFENNIRPAVIGTRIMSNQQADAIAARLSAIENIKISEPEKLGLARRLILQSFAGAVSGAPGRYRNATIPDVPQRPEDK